VTDHTRPPRQSGAVLELDGVTKIFINRPGFFGRRESLHAVDDVSLSVSAGETLGIVGESGSGKSTLARMAVGLDRPTSGVIRLDGIDIFERSPESRKARRNLQMVFQDPAASLNPKLRVGQSIAEPLLGSVSSTEAQSRVRDLLKLVGLGPEIARRYPGQLSGGQQQRVCIARVLIADPRIVVHDEAVSALDVSIQAQVLNLLADLQDRLGLTYVFISHDLAVVQMISTRIAVMYLGQVVEIMPADQLNNELLHPYSLALRSAVPVPNPTLERSRERILLPGDMPNPINPPSGCRFHTRCFLVQDRCRVDEPVLRELAPGRWSACHFAGQFDQGLGGLSPSSVPVPTRVRHA
jgi:oligopeptide/dipeptide ABC transporter ATP-binding protein